MTIRSNGHLMSCYHPAKPFVGGQLQIVLPGNQHLGKAQPVGFFDHAGQRQQSLETGCKCYEAFSLVVIKCGISADVPCQQKPALACIPGNQRPIALEVRAEFLTPAIETHPHQMPVEQPESLRSRDMECFQKSSPVVQPCRADYKSAFSPHRLLLKNVFRIQLKQQMPHRHRPLDLAVSTVGSVVGHCLLHPVQPTGIYRGPVISINAVNSAQDCLRAKVVNVLKFSCPGPPVTTSEPRRSQACASKPADSPLRAPKLTVPSRPRRRNIPVAASAWARQRPSHGTRSPRTPTRPPLHLLFCVAPPSSPPPPRSPTSQLRAFPATRPYAGKARKPW